jgi:uncharacterized membrane protein
MTRGPNPGRPDRAEPLANPTRRGKGTQAMKHFHDEIRIDAPVERVWAFYCDTSHWKDWMPRGEFKDFSGPVDKVGTTYTGGMRILGYEMKSTVKVVEVEPQRLIHEHTDWGPEDNYMRFEPENGATHLVIDSDYELPGKLPGFIKDLAAKGWMERTMHQALEDFKALAETKVETHA